MTKARAPAAAWQRAVRRSDCWAETLTPKTSSEPRVSTLQSSVPDQACSIDAPDAVRWKSAVALAMRRGPRSARKRKRPVRAHSARTTEPRSSERRVRNAQRPSTSSTPATPRAGCTGWMPSRSVRSPRMTANQTGRSGMPPASVASSPVPNQTPPEAPRAACRSDWSSGSSSRRRLRSGALPAPTRRLTPLWSPPILEGETCRLPAGGGHVEERDVVEGDRSVRHLMPPR